MSYVLPLDQKYNTFLQILWFFTSHSTPTFFKISSLDILAVQGTSFFNIYWTTILTSFNIDEFVTFTINGTFSIFTSNITFGKHWIYATRIRKILAFSWFVIWWLFHIFASCVNCPVELPPSYLGHDLSHQIADYLIFVDSMSRSCHYRSLVSFLDKTASLLLTLSNFWKKQFLFILSTRRLLQCHLNIFRLMEF